MAQVRAVTPNEAAVAIRDVERMIDEMRRAQEVADDWLLLARIGYQLDALRREQRYLIGLLMRDPLR